MKIIRVTSCSTCPYKKVHWSPNKSVYEGTSCSHPDVKKLHLDLYGIEDCFNRVHYHCPLESIDIICQVT